MIRYQMPRTLPRMTAFVVGWVAMLFGGGQTIVAIGEAWISTGTVPTAWLVVGVVGLICFSDAVRMFILALRAERSS